MADALAGRARALLEDRNLAHLTTIEEDGAPHAVVVWVLVEDGHVVVNSAEGRRWARNLRRDPRVALVVVNPEDPSEYVEIRGRVTEDTHELADEVVDALARKYTGADFQNARRPGEQRVTFRIAPERVRLASS